jgi:hypothetical protein
MRATWLDPELGIESRQDRLAGVNPLVDGQDIVCLTQRAERRLHVGQLSLQALDRRIEIFRPGASEIGQQRAPHA